MMGIWNESERDKKFASKEEGKERKEKEEAVDNI